VKITRQTEAVTVLTIKMSGMTEPREITTTINVELLKTMIVVEAVIKVARNNLH
jgi:hypothetical protein